MFQGLKSLREENWKPLPVEVSAIDTILLTHGHLDHTGYIPRLVQQGFQGTIYGTAPTLAVTKIILEDSAKIHEEEAEKAKASAKKAEEAKVAAEKAHQLQKENTVCTSLLIVCMMIPSIV